LKKTWEVDLIPKYVSAGALGGLGHARKVL